MSGCVEKAYPSTPKPTEPIGRWTRTSCLRWISLNQKCEMRKMRQMAAVLQKDIYSGMRNQFLHDLERYCKIRCFALVFEFISATSKSSCSQLYSCLLHRWDNFITKDGTPCYFFVQISSFRNVLVIHFMIQWCVFLCISTTIYDRTIRMSDVHQVFRPWTRWFFCVPCYQKSWWM